MNSHDLLLFLANSELDSTRWAHRVDLFMSYDKLEQHLRIHVWSAVRVQNLTKIVGVCYQNFYLFSYCIIFNSKCNFLKHVGLEIQLQAFKGCLRSIYLIFPVKTSAISERDTSFKIYYEFFVTFYCYHLVRIMYIYCAYRWKKNIYFNELVAKPNCRHNSDWLIKIPNL